MAKSLGGSEDGMMAPDQPLSIYKQTVAEKDLECAQGLDRVGGGVQNTWPGGMFMVRFTPRKDQ